MPGRRKRVREMDELRGTPEGEDTLRLQAGFRQLPYEIAAYLRVTELTKGDSVIGHTLEVDTSGGPKVYIRIGCSSEDKSVRVYVQEHDSEEYEKLWTGHRLNRN